MIIADLVIYRHIWDLTSAEQLVDYLPIHYPLGGLDGQQEFGRLLLELPKNGFWVSSASAWISTPSRSNSPKSCRSTTRSWFSPVAKQAKLNGTARSSDYNNTWAMNTDPPPLAYLIEPLKALP